MATGLSLSYGDIQLEQVQTHAYRREDVMNGPDYLYTRHELHISGVVNPKTVQQAIAQNPRDAQTVDLAVRDYLLQPRQTLSYGIATTPPFQTTWFVVTTATKGGVTAQPGKNQANLYFDQNNGPQPLYCQATMVVGTRSILISWGISWCVAERLDRGSKTQPPPLISNRWVMTHSFDKQQFEEIHCRGRAIFRTDSLTSLSKNPDDYRNSFLLPVLPGYTRQGLVVTEAQDATAIEYEFVDRQHVLAPTSQYIAHIDLKQTFLSSRQGLEEKVEAVGRAAIRTAKIVKAAKATAGHTAGLDPGKAAEAFGDLDIAIAEHGVATLRDAHNMLTRTVVQVDCTVYGTPAAPLINVGAAWTACILAKLKQVNGFGAGTTAACVLDPVNNIVTGYVRLKLVPAVELFVENGNPVFQGDNLGNLPSGYINKAAQNPAVKGTLQPNQKVGPTNNYGQPSGFSPLVELFTAVIRDQGTPAAPTWPKGTQGQTFAQANQARYNAQS